MPFAFFPCRLPPLPRPLRPPGLPPLPPLRQGVPASPSPRRAGARRRPGAGARRWRACHHPHRLGGGRGRWAQRRAAAGRDRHDHHVGRGCRRCRPPRRWQPPPPLPPTPPPRTVASLPPAVDPAAAADADAAASTVLAAVAPAFPRGGWTAGRERGVPRTAPGRCLGSHPSGAALPPAAEAEPGRRWATASPPPSCSPPALVTAAAAVASGR